MPINGLLPAYPRTGNPDHTPGINIRTHVALAIFTALVESQGTTLLASGNRDALIDAFVVASWARADEFLLGG
jgi:hypothetical protein